MNAIILTHNHINAAAKATARDMAVKGVKRAYPIPRGGVPAAYAIQRHYPALEVVDSPVLADCYIDDLIDSGATKARYEDKPFFALYTKHETPGWIVFPWEGSIEGSAEDVGTRLLQFIGEDPTREGLLETPARYLKAWKEWTSGYGRNAEEVLKVEFADGGEDYDQMVLIDPISFFSHCEHHLTPIFGTVHMAYIPNGKIAGLSKFARLVEVFARRLQVQERLTTQIASTIDEVLSPLGVGVVIRARHLCMESRGAKAFGTETTTIALRGCLKNEDAARAEFMSIIKGR